MSERVWVFNEQQLADALKEWCDTNKANLSVAHDEETIKNFLVSEAAARQKLLMVCNPKIRPAMDPADIKEPKRDTTGQLVQP